MDAEYMHIDRIKSSLNSGRSSLVNEKATSVLDFHLLAFINAQQRDRQTFDMFDNLLVKNFVEYTLKL